MIGAPKEKEKVHPDPRPSAAEALEPFRPGVDGPWDRAAASHLVRRAGFGMPPAAVDGVLAAGPRAAAEKLLLGDTPSSDEEFASETAGKLGTLDAAQASWVYRMLRGTHPAREKLALFWHGRFATSVRKVEDVRLMLRQVEVFRTKGAGPFADLLLEVARDPAMLVWLDGNSNRRGHPNENLAREIMELFSLGIGNYTEEDIKEAARALTGWHVKNDEFWNNERAHDTGEKEIFGQTGKFGGEDVVRLCAGRPACAEFIAAKLFEFYVHAGPSPELRREMGKCYSASGLKTGEFLIRLFSSRVFYSQRARRAIVATPADFAVGSLRTLTATASTRAVARAMAAMGQELLAPPSVKGWDLGLSWLSSPTLLSRLRYAAEVCGEAGQDLGAEVPWERLRAERPGIRQRFFPEGLPAAAAAAAGEGGPRDVAAVCLQLPESQFI